MGSKSQGRERLLNDLMSARLRIAELETTLEELHNKLEMAQLLVNTPTDSILLVDSDSNILATNAIAAQRLGRPAHELIGTCLHDYFPPDIAASRQELIKQAFQSGKLIRAEDRRSSIWFDTILHPILSEQGTIDVLVIHAREINQRKQLEMGSEQHRERLEQLLSERTTELTKANEQLRQELAERERAEAAQQEQHRMAGALCNTAHILGSALDVNQVLDQALDCIGSIAPCDLSSVMIVTDESAQVVRSCRYPSHEPVAWINGQRLLVEEEPLLRTARSTHQAVLVPDMCDSECWMACSRTSRSHSCILVPMYFREDLLGFLHVIRLTLPSLEPNAADYLHVLAGQIANAISNARLFGLERGAKERLGSLSRRLISVQEAERRRIAREIHDEIGQLMTSLKISLERSLRCLPKGQAQHHLMEAQNLIANISDTMRDLVLNLRPPMLDDLGLVPALLSHFKRYFSLTEVHVDFKHHGVQRRFHPHVETAAYRIIQEALTNVARHAQVTEVMVSLWVEQGSLNLQVEDHGRGFKPEEALASNHTSGLSGARERAYLLGGRFAIEASPGKGSCLRAELPLSSELYEDGGKSNGDNHFGR